MTEQQKEDAKRLFEIASDATQAGRTLDNGELNMVIRDMSKLCLHMINAQEEQIEEERKKWIGPLAQKIIVLLFSAVAGCAMAIATHVYSVTTTSAVVVTEHESRLKVDESVRDSHERRLTELEKDMKRWRTEK